MLQVGIEEALSIINVQKSWNKGYHQAVQLLRFLLAEPILGNLTESNNSKNKILRLNLYL